MINYTGIFSICIILVLSLSGCSKPVEPNELAYVVAVGIDRGEESENYKYTLQIADPMVISGGSGEEGGKDSDKTVFTASVAAPSVFSAVNILNHMYSKQITLSHTKLVAICADIAEKDGIRTISETVTRSEEIRPNTHMTIVKGEASEYLKNVKPKNEVNPVKYYEDLYNSYYRGYIPKVRTMDFYSYDLSNEKENVLPLSAVASENPSDSSELEGFEHMMKDYIAGEIEEKSEVKAQTLGMAIFLDDKMIAEAGAVETELYNIITGDYDRSEITYLDSKDPAIPVTVLQSQEKKPEIDVEIGTDAPIINVTLYLEGDLRTVSQAYLVEQELDNLEEQIKSEIKTAVDRFLAKTVTEYKSDIIGFGSYAKRHFKSFDDFTAYNWKEKYQNASFNTEIEFHLRRSGLINRKRG